MFVESNSMLYSLANLIRLGLTIYMWIVVIRAVISWVNPNPYNQVVQFLAKVTDPVLNSIRRLLPVSYGGIDFSPIVLILLIVFFNDFVVEALAGLSRGMPAMNILPLFILSFLHLIQGLLFALMIVLIVRAVLSWISPDPYNPIVQVIYGLTEPLLYRIRKLLPLVHGGIDFTPIIMIAVIYFVNVLLDYLVFQITSRFFG